MDFLLVLIEVFFVCNALTFERIDPEVHFGYVATSLDSLDQVYHGYSHKIKIVSMFFRVPNSNILIYKLNAFGMQVTSVRYLGQRRVQS